jgi:NAD+ synthetase
MKVCLGQINTTPGDFSGNLAAILNGTSVANAGGADVILFPELTIPGYLSQDLMYHSRFIERNLEVLNELTEHSKTCFDNLHIVVGYIDRNTGPGKPFFNMAAVIRAGEIIGTYKKQLLPFYDVFDELRYFEPGTELLTFPVVGKQVGVTICEDLWNDKGSDDYNHKSNPFEQYRRKEVDVVLSLNSSPYVNGKPEQRFSVIGPGTVDGTTVVYVNQYGGQDELVFDGSSFVMTNGQTKHLAANVQEDSFDIVDIESKSSDEPRPSLPSLYTLLVLCLRDYVRKTGFSRLVLASSGGVDSAVVCQIACDAIGPENVHAIRMPSIFSSDHSRDDALALHENLGCVDYELPIDHEATVEFLNATLSEGKDGDNLVVQKITDGYGHVADENIQARLRDLYVMHFSNAFDAMPLSTGNKTESACGYYTHFDMNFSFAPIKDLYKFQVMDIARESEGIPDNIWRKPPSAELAHGQTDEASLLPYSVLDPIVAAHIEEYVSTLDEFREWVMAKGDSFSCDPAELREWLQSENAESSYQRIIRLIGRMEYKRRQTCPGTKVSRVAFGIGRRLPIVEKWT